MSGVNIQVRMPKQVVRDIDEEVKAGVFVSRSDAIRTIVRLYELAKKREEFFKMLEERAREIERGEFIPLKELKTEVEG